jgi:DNA-binding NarL/FixJ family response regulator
MQNRVRLAVAAKEDVDVIVLDLHLKQGTGFGVMRAQMSVQHKPTIIVLTSYDLPEYKNASLAFGATHFLDKARDFGCLSEILFDIRERQLALQPRIGTSPQTSAASSDTPVPSISDQWGDL